MEEEKQLAGEDRLSGEIVEVYRQPLPGEVVERYSPLEASSLYGYTRL